MTGTSAIVSSSALRLCGSAVLAGGLSLLVFSALPADLDVQTDIVGYPTFANFNIDRYVWAYALTVVFFPLVTFGSYLLLTRVFTVSQAPRGPIPRPLERVEAISIATGWREWLVAFGRTSFVGAVLGYEVAIVLQQSSEVVLATALTYVAGVGFSAWFASRRRGSRLLDIARSVNTMVAPLALAGLYGVSSSTEVTVSASGVVHAFPWLPAWLAIGAAVLVLVWLGTRLRSSTSPTDRNALERRALMLVVAPVGLFVFLASLPGALGTFDVYEEGQTLAAAEITREGAFPWRDLLVAHGFLHDVLYGLIGTGVFEDSRWGVTAGNELLVEPITWVGVYYLSTFLFGANWLFLLGAQLLVVTEYVHSPLTRFVLLPFVLLLLAALLQRPSVARAVAFTTLLALQIVLTPEALAAGIAYGATLVLFELYYYERGRGLRAGFRRVWLCAATATGLAAAWSVFLAANGALDDWIFSFATFIPGHRLTGGIPLLVAKTEFEVVAPVVLVLAVFAFFAVWTRLRYPLALQDWVMLAAGGLTLLYYNKFLSRADAGHLLQSFFVGVPLLFYAVYRGVTFAEAALARIASSRGWPGWPARHTLTAPLLVALLLFSPVALPDVARAVPGKFAPTAPREPVISRIGFDRPAENDAEAIRDLGQAVRSLVGPDAAVFDFSNAPGLFHYLLDLPASTRYYHVSLAIRQRTQTDLLRLLERRLPELVVLTSDGAGRSLPSWDGIPNQVRHYDVSEFLLDHYVPVLDSHGFVLMTRRDLGRDAVPELYFHVDPCDWGYVPSFFSPRPATSNEAVQLPFRRLEASPRLAVTLPADAADYGWLEVRTGEPLAQGGFELSDRPGGDARRSITFEALDRGETTIRVKVGACSQWRGYRARTLYLTESVPQDIREIRLVR